MVAMHMSYNAIEFAILMSINTVASFYLEGRDMCAIGGMHRPLLMRRDVALVNKAAQRLEVGLGGCRCPILAARHDTVLKLQMASAGAPSAALGFDHLCLVCSLAAHSALLTSSCPDRFIQAYAG